MSCNCDNNNNDNENIPSCENEKFGALFNPNCELIKCCVEENLCKKVDECLEKKRCKTQFEWSPPCFTEIVPEPIKNRINRRGQLITRFLNTIRPLILDALLTNDYTDLCDAINNNPFIEEFSITDRNGDVIVIC
jgi:hypothetical protein